MFNLFSGFTLVLLMAGMGYASPRLDMYGRSLEGNVRLLAMESDLGADEAFENPIGGEEITHTFEGGFSLSPYVAHPIDKAHPSWPDAVAIGDVTNDGLADVVLTTTYTYFGQENNYQVFVFPQTEMGELGSPSRYPYGQSANSNGLAIVDLDGMNALDIVVGGDSGLSLLRSAAEGGFNVSAPVATQPSMAIVPVDLRGTGRQDIVSVSWNSGYIHLNNGDGTMSGQSWPITLAGYNSMAKGDLDGDGLEDVVVAEGQGMQPSIHAYRNNGDGTLTELRSLSGGCESEQPVNGIGIGDVNGDGIADIVASSGGNRPNSCILVFLGKGQGEFAGPVSYASHDIPETLQVVDINRDGRDDVVVVHGGWAALGVYLQQNDGTLAPETLYPIPYASSYAVQGLAVADFSGDECPDVAIADYQNGLVTLFGVNCVVDEIFADDFQ